MHPEELFSILQHFILPQQRIDFIKVLLTVVLGHIKYLENGQHVIYYHYNPVAPVLLAVGLQWRICVYKFF